LCSWRSCRQSHLRQSHLQWLRCSQRPCHLPLRSLGPQESQGPKCWRRSCRLPLWSLAPWSLGLWLACPQRQVQAPREGRRLGEAQAPDLALAQDQRPQSVALWARAHRFAVTLPRPGFLERRIHRPSLHKLEWLELRSTMQSTICHYQRQACTLYWWAHPLQRSVHTAGRPQRLEFRNKYR